MTTLPRLCLVEDDEIMGESLVDRFRLEDFDVDWFRDVASARAAIMHATYASVISDVRLGDADGGELYVELRRSGLQLPPFIFITGFGSIDRAVRLLKEGAEDYVTKPFDLDQLVAKVQALAAVHCGPLAHEAEVMLGASPAMRRIQDQLPRLAAHAITLLVTGESGVGKEHVAQLYHRLAQGNAAQPFIAVNCGALPESLMEAELFGYEKGAFTGAVKAKRGVFEQAHGGTLFLDEIGEMPPPMQVKLLRTIQDKRVARLGSETSLPISFRLVCATHRDLKAMVDSGAFREDLYYRINVIHLRVPPLRERPEDVLWFLDRFLMDFEREHGAPRRSVSPSAKEALMRYPWPGNLRELKHSIERACILSAGATLQPEDFFESPVENAEHEPEAMPLSEYLARCERSYLQRVLERNEGQIARCAAELGISRKNLWEKMRKMGLQSPSA